MNEQIPRYSEGASLFRAKYRIASMRSHLVRLPSNTFASEFQGAFRVKALNCYGQPPLILKTEVFIFIAQKVIQYST